MAIRKVQESNSASKESLQLSQQHKMQLDGQTGSLLQQWVGRYLLRSGGKLIHRHVEHYTKPHQQSRKLRESDMLRGWEVMGHERKRIQRTSRKTSTERHKYLLSEHNDKHKSKPVEIKKSKGQRHKLFALGSEVTGSSCLLIKTVSTRAANC